MANLKSVKRVAQVTINLGGELRQIKYDLNAFAELENRFGSVEQAMNTLNEGSMKSIRSILWAGLIHDQAILDDAGEPISYKITPYQVGAWIQPNTLNDIVQSITSVLSDDLPEATEVTDPVELPAVVGEDGMPMATVQLTPEEQVEEAKNV